MNTRQLDNYTESCIQKCNWSGTVAFSKANMQVIVPQLLLLLLYGPYVLHVTVNVVQLDANAIDMIQ